MPKRYRSRVAQLTASWDGLRLGCVLFVTLLCQPAFALTGKLWEVDKIVRDNAVAGHGNSIKLHDGGSTAAVRVDHLRTLLEAHRKIGAVSGINAALALVVDAKPQATASFSEGRIVVTTGMLDIVGGDAHMAAALLGHEFAHLSLRHAVQRVRNLPALALNAAVTAETVSRQTGDNAAATRAGGETVKVLSASFSRQQEAEADKAGAEFVTSAGYDPNGMLRLMNTFLKLTGGVVTGYLDTHPGFEERLAKARPTVANQEHDAVAAGLARSRNWKGLAQMVDPWLKAHPDSGRAWYYQGVALRGLGRAGALPAFEKAVVYDPNFSFGWLALCVELYRQDRPHESLMCSERLPRGELHDEYEAKTFKHPVYVGGIAAPAAISEWESRIIQAVMKSRAHPSPQQRSALP